MKQQNHRAKGESVYNPTAVLIMLYQSEDNQPEKIIEMLNNCRLNPNFDIRQRNDLEYYIPQLINYLVFHEELGNQLLISFIIQASSVDFHFAQLVYWQLKSVSAIITSKERLVLEDVQNFVVQFKQQMSQVFQVQRDNTLMQSAILNYGTNYYEPRDVLISAKELTLNTYRSIFKFPFENEIPPHESQFFSNLEFWQDLVMISGKLIQADPRIISLKADLQKINQRLPANVSIPFLDIYQINIIVRQFNILNIVFQESKVFSTKERAPFYICLEIFNHDEGRAERISDAKTLKKSRLSDQKRTEYLLSVSSEEIIKQQAPPKIRLTLDKTRSPRLQTILENSQANSAQDSKQVSTLHHDDGGLDVGVGVFYENTAIEPKSETVYRSFVQQVSGSQEEFVSLASNNFQDLKSSPNLEFLQQNQITQPQQPSHMQTTQSVDLRGSILKDFEQLDDKRAKEKKKKFLSLTKEQRYELGFDVFGESEQEQTLRIKRNSPFSKLNDWQLVHLIVKSGDNLKQEQFAMQLISQINQIFESEGLPLHLTTYEVLSIGPDSGLIQMVKDAVTIDSLKKTLHEKYRHIKNLKEFFHTYFDDNIREAQTNFLYSLVAYSLACYFLQLKDRHNGNILLHREGYLIHIDFGFLLSNSPGKGIEIEKKVPFKLIQEYIDVIGGLDSQLFERFRKLFFQGFMAIRKNKDKLLLLVKMMYSGHGTTLPCFKKGKRTLVSLETRFFSQINSEAELYVECQTLINRSINNWRARWYDKYQYLFQGIFY